jgi:hypothetical protein
VCAYVSAIVAFIGLPAALKPGGEGLIAWIAQTFLQLVLLSIIIVGQNIAATASDRRSGYTYKDAQAILSEALEIQKHLAAQHEELMTLLKDAVTKVEGAGASPRTRERSARPRPTARRLSALTPCARITEQTGAFRHEHWVLPSEVQASRFESRFVTIRDSAERTSVMTFSHYRQPAWLLGGLCAAVIAGGVLAPRASAESHGLSAKNVLIASKADSTGQIVVDSNGNGYLAWLNQATGDKADPVLFCKIPAGTTKCKKQIVLPLPGGATDSDDGTVQPFPVLGAQAGTVYVVAPRYVRGDSVIWTSNNGGTSFSLGQEIPVGSYADLTSADDVIRDPGSPSGKDEDYFDVASHNPGLGYAFTSTQIVKEPDPTSFYFSTSGVPGGVNGSTLGVQGDGPVEAFWTDADPPTVDYFWSTATTQISPSGWNGPVKVGNGQNARLAGGPGGLYLLSEDGNSQGTAKMLKLDVRKWNATSHKFGSAQLVQSIPNDASAGDQGGFGEDASTGALVVAWPVHTKGNLVIDLWTSSNGGTTFTGPTDIATVKGAFVGPLRVAVTDGAGFLTSQDGGGLELIGLSGL